MPNRLVLLNGPTPGASVALDESAEAFTIGRDSLRDLPIDDHSASRLHARVTCEGGTWQIEDCESRNGTWVNSQPVRRSVLEPGDLVRVGDRLIVFLNEPQDAEPGGLRPSVFAASTCKLRIPAPAKRDAILQAMRRDASSPAIRRLAVMCRLATSLHACADVKALIRLVTETMSEATDCQTVNIWLLGTDGRLHPVADGADVSAKDNDPHLLASLAVENDEAMLVELPAGSATSSSSSTDKAGTVMSVPIPGGRGRRGAMECTSRASADALGQEELEFAIAVAHQLGLALASLEHREQLEGANEQLRKRLGAETRILGSSRPMQNLLDEISRVAPTSANVLVIGESGTGKELVAQSIHEFSPRAAGPFVTTNCAAFSESLLESELFGHEPGAFTGANKRRSGQFERAHRGTIFLDEVGEMSLACQAKLLRLLEGHPFERLGGSEPVQVDVRIVAATHRDLPELIRQGSFREDLYYRLRVIELAVPPLRERGDDVMDLAAHFLEFFRRKVGHGPVRFSREAAERIADYDWPGNVREMKNAIERAVVLGRGEEVAAADLALATTTGRAAKASPLVSLAESEKRHIEHVLAAVGDNKTKACKILKIGRGTLYKKLEE